MYEISYRMMQDAAEKGEFVRNFVQNEAECSRGELISTKFLTGPQD